MFKNYSYQLVVTIVVAFVCAAMQSYADDARWRYVETPEICGRFQCEFINDSTMLCVSDSCGVYRLSAPDWVAHKVVIDTNEWRFVPRSIARSKDGKIHIVGHRTGWTAWRDSLKNWQLVPMHYTSSDLGVTWNHVNHPDDQYGKYQCISCSKSENTCIVAFDRRTLDDGNEVWFDSHQVVVQVYHNDELRSSVDLSSSGLSDCGRGHYDEFTIRLAYDGINGVAVWYTAPCEKIIWNPDYKRRYREARFYSIDGGLTFPFVIYYPASEAQWFLSVRPTYSTGHIYLSPDILLHYQFVSHDQGKSWNNNPARIPVEGDLDSVWIGELSPGVIKGRTAVGEFSRDLQPIVDGYQVSSLGSFNLDYGGFKVEHTDTLESFGGPARASAAGYAV
ncbi:MAG: hypothetical protein HQ472_04410, partial [Ignavibacteria bacterium]|nr:hypothetical protein [Ignavibacteria bacterium]